MHHACVLEVMAWGLIPPEPDMAWSHYQALVALVNRGSTQRQYLIRMAGVLARTGLADSARAVIRQAQADATSFADTIPLIGVYFRLGEQDAANALYEQYLERDPDGAAELASRRILRPFVTPSNESPR